MINKNYGKFFILFSGLVTLYFQENLKHSLKRIFNKQDLEKQILDKFENSTTFFKNDKKSKNQFVELEDPESFGIKRLNLPSNPTEGLTVLVGESGVGKTTSVCKYAKNLRDNGYPVYYYTLRDKNENTTRNLFIQAFATDDLEAISEVIIKNYTSKGKTATFIIDNIDYCEKDGQMGENTLIPLNVIFYQRLGMNVVMLSSVNQFAYTNMQSGTSNFSNLSKILSI